MNVRPLVGIGFLLHAFLGPLCMAVAIETTEIDAHAVEHHAGHETNDDAPMDCAGHCLEQAKDVVTSDAPALPVSHAILQPFDSWDLAFAVIERDNESPVSSPPFSLSTEKTVLLL